MIDNGFVHVGDCEFIESPRPIVKMSNCKNIRQWGTSKGLGELATGPTEKSQVDDCGTVLVPFDRVVFFLQVTSGW